MKRHRSALLASANAAHAYVHQTELQKKNALDSFISSLNVAEKLSQLFLVNIDGNETFRAVESFEGKPLIPGGYIFFSYNLQPDPERINHFNASIYKNCSINNSIAPFLSIDAEGGYVNRLRGIAGPLPEAHRVSECLTPSEAFKLYTLNAVQLKALGFNMNLAPVSEVLTEDNEKFLDGRSFGSLTEVTEYASSAVRAYEKQKVASVLKHFPGNSNVDPHTGLPYLKFTQKDLENLVLKPFGNVIKNNPSFVLMSHAIAEADGYSESKKKIPSCLSKFWVQEMLREKLNFKGIIVSDDIFMDALEENGYPPKRAVSMALDAGVNCIMMSEKYFAKELKMLIDLYDSDENYRKKMQDSVRRILDWKLSNGILSSEFVDGKWKISCEADFETFEENADVFNNAYVINQMLYEEKFFSTADINEKRAVMVNSK